MSMDDKARHRGEELKGSVKEGWGKLTNNGRSKLRARQRSGPARPRAPSTRQSTT